MSFERMRAAWRIDSAFWRRAMAWGIQRGPDAWVRYSPAVIGWTFSAALAEPRRAVRESLRLVHGVRPAHQELRDIATVFANFAASMTEGMLLGAERGYHLTTRPVGAWNFMSAAAKGRGMIVATAQTAGWDVAAGALAEVQTRDVWVLMNRESDEDARQLHDRFRQAAGFRIVHVGNDPLASLPLLRHLRKGGIVTLKMDRLRPGMRTRAVQLLGQPWHLAEGPFRLAQLTGAPIVPVFVRRLGFLDYQTISGSPIHVPRRLNETQLDAAAQGLTDELERFVRAYPTQWLRFH